MESITEILRFIRLSPDLKQFRMKLSNRHKKGSSIPDLFNDIISFDRQGLSLEAIKNRIKKKYPNINQDAYTLKNETIKFVLKDESLNIYERLCRVIGHSENLYCKGYYSWAKKYNVEAEKLAKQYDTVELIPVILKLKKQLENVLEIESNNKNVLIDAKENIEKLNRINRIDVRQTQLREMMGDVPMGEREEKKKEEVGTSNLERKTAISKREEVTQCVNQFLIANKKGDWKGMLKYSQKGYNVIQGNNRLENTFSTLYSYFIVKMIGCLQHPEINKPLEARRLIEKYKDYKWTSFNSQIFFEQFLMPVQMNMYINTKSKEYRSENLKNLEHKFLKNYHFYHPEIRVLLPVCFLIEACALREMNKAQNWVHLLETRFKQYFSIREDLLDLMKLLKLLISFEEKEFEELKRECRNVKRRLNTRQKYFESEKALLNFFNSSLKYYETINIEYKSKDRFERALKKIISKLVELSKNENEAVFLSYFNWVNWFKAKLEEMAS